MPRVKALLNIGTLDAEKHQLPLLRADEVAEVDDRQAAILLRAGWAVAAEEKAEGKRQKAEAHKPEA